MSREYQIIVVCDGDERCHDLKVVLDFLGEPATMVKPIDFQQQLQSPNKILAVIVGDIEQQQQEHDIVQSLMMIKTGLSVLKFADNDVSTDHDATTHSIFVEDIPFPLQSTQLIDILHRCQIRKENANRDSVDGQRPIPLFRSMVGNSEKIQSIRQLIEQVSDSDVSVLILGESGTGKEIAARNLHRYSARKEKPFVPINCGAIPAELLESEIFGHEKGSFTGAIATRQGRFEMAAGGTLFLDEIGDMPLAMQVKLLRVLQEHTFEKVGSNKSIATDVRIIAATHRNLDEEIAKGRFREDLYYRLNVFPIEMPSLRDRMEDLPLLIDELITRIKSENRPTFHMSSKAINSLSRYDWPGNIRELANLIERLAILYPNAEVGVDDLPEKFKESRGVQGASAIQSTPAINLAQPQLPTEGIDLKEHLSQLELSLIQQALAQANGVVAKAAESLSMRRTTLVEKMRKYGVTRDFVVKE